VKPARKPSRPVARPIEADNDPGEHLSPEMKRFLDWLIQQTMKENGFRDDSPPEARQRVLDAYAFTMSLASRSAYYLEHIKAPCVYFVQAVDGGPVKIGKAKRLAQRLRTLQTASTKRLLVRRAVLGDDEPAFHARFARYRIRGEWFRYDGDLCRFLGGGPL
jgi:hypothetical protein